VPARSRLSLAERPLRDAADRRVAAWLRGIAAGGEAALGPVDDATAHVLRGTRLDALAYAHGARHPALDGVERREFAAVTLRLTALARALDALRATGTPVAVLKGLPLAQRYWGDAYVRPASDVDLLVDPSDYARARAALVAIGFAVRDDWVPSWYLERWFYHETLEGTGPLRGSMELHWDYVRPGLGDTDVRGLLGAAVAIDVAGRSLPAPAPPWQLLVVAAHAVHEFFGARHLLDVTLVARALDAADWRVAVDLAAGARLGPTLWYAVAAAAEWLDWEAPDVLERLRPATARDEVARRFIRRLPPLGRVARADLQMQHVLAPALSSAGARALTRIPFALLTDRGHLAMRVERARRRVLGRPSGDGPTGAAPAG
jgi:hypothetical protein